MPPGVAVLNYISRGILWRIFLPNCNFRGVFFKYYYFAVKISEAAMDGGHYIFWGAA